MSKTWRQNLAAAIDVAIEAAQEETRHKIAEGLFGRTLKPRKPLTVTTPTRAARPKRKNPWASLSPAERLARVNAIRKGRGLPPRKV